MSKLNNKKDAKSRNKKKNLLKESFFIIIGLFAVAGLVTMFVYIVVRLMEESLFILVLVILFLVGWYLAYEKIAENKQ